jgi:hypothetical protein
MGSLIFLNSLWLIAVEPHRGGSISLRPSDTFYIHPALTEVVEQALLEIAPPAARQR